MIIQIKLALNNELKKNFQIRAFKMNKVLQRNQNCNLLHIKNRSLYCSWLENVKNNLLALFHVLVLVNIVITTKNHLHPLL